MVLNTIINAIFILVKKKALKFATKLLHIMNHQNILDKYAFELIRLQFMQKLVDFINTKNEINMQLFFTALKSLNFNQEVEDFSFAFSQIKNI